MAQAWNASILQSHHWNYDAMLYRQVLCHLQGVGGRGQHPLRDRSIPSVHILPLPAPPCCCLHTKPRWVRSATSPLLILLGAEHAQGHPSQEDEAGKSVSSSKSITIFFFSLHAWTSPNTYSSHLFVCSCPLFHKQSTKLASCSYRGSLGQWLTAATGCWLHKATHQAGLHGFLTWSAS